MGISMEDQTLDRQIQVTHSTLETRLEKQFSLFAKTNVEDWQTFKTRLKRNFSQLFRLYFQLYSNLDDFNFHFEDLLKRIAQSWIERSVELKRLDASRESDPLWYPICRIKKIGCLPGK
jgi:amylosucrase